MAISKSQHDHSYKLLVVGDKGVGKTLFSTIDSILNSEEWKIDYVGYKERKKEINLNGERIKLTIKSFDNLNNWLYEINKYENKHVMKLIIGNKCDLARQKVVSSDKATEYLIRSNISMFEVSAQDSTNVEPAFEHMILKIRSSSTLTNNDEPDHDREEIVLKFVPYIFDIGSNAVEQHVNDQGFHDSTENEHEQLLAITEENAGVKHAQSVDD
ncbi:unnamed protein product [Adineta steineri]|uniref:Uncharacterized protein n=1 Tax=Adineta steineri TaxID=433720 RepID=A0A819SSL2_9BILA|nr:unnamed protein product [Adineta steineri]CAF4076319.1 unnamed protein product [Adineta steineri]